MPPFSSRAIKEYLSRSAWVSVGQLAQVFPTGTEILVIGKTLGAGSVVIYACTTKLLSVLGNPPQLLMQVALPGLSEMKTGETTGLFCKLRLHWARRCSCSAGHLYVLSLL